MNRGPTGLSDPFSVASSITKWSSWMQERESPRATDQPAPGQVENNAPLVVAVTRTGS